VIRVLVVEDSSTMRALLVKVLDASPQIQVVGEAVLGREAVTMACELRPDLITMDVVLQLSHEPYCLTKKETRVVEDES